MRCQATSQTGSTIHPSNIHCLLLLYLIQQLFFPVVLAGNESRTHPGIKPLPLLGPGVVSWRQGPAGWGEAGNREELPNPVRSERGSQIEEALPEEYSTDSGRPGEPLDCNGQAPTWDLGPGILGRPETNLGSWAGFDLDLTYSRIATGPDP